MIDEIFNNKKYKGKKSINLGGYESVPVMSVEEISQSINTQVFTDNPYHTYVEYAIVEPICYSKIYYSGSENVPPIDEPLIKRGSSPLFSTAFVPCELRKIQGLIELFLKHENVYYAAAPEVVLADVAHAYHEIAKDTGEYANCMWVSRNMVVLMNISPRCVNYYATANENHEIVRISDPLVCRKKSMIVVKAGMKNNGIRKNT